MRKACRAEIGERVARALGHGPLEGFDARKPAQLSGGQQQRVALARALVFNPALVLMDEPLGALDKQLREQMQIEIKHIQKDLGLTVVYVTHDQSEALTMSDRIAVFNEGSCSSSTSPRTCMSARLNTFVAQFIGENNRLAGTVLSISPDGSCSVTVDGGQTVAARRSTSRGRDRPTVLSIRPERVAVTPGEGECESVLQARVEELIYHGDHARVRLDLPGNLGFVVKLPHAQAGISLQTGDIVEIGWRGADCRALDGRQGTTTGG